MQAFIDKIFDLQKFGIKLGLDSTLKLLGKLGSPQHGLKCAHIAGTNGKGSVGATLEAICMRAGLKTGYYVSPHLQKVNERFRLNGKPIGDTEFLSLGREVWEAMGKEPCTFFEFTSALAFLYFKREKVDLAIMETGMGGMWDSTNVCEPLVSIITNIAFDHKEHLGSSIAAIARDKAGIIKPGVPVISGASQKSARAAIEQKAAFCHSPLYFLGREIKIRRRGEFFYLKGMDLPEGRLRSALRGTHQPRNAALAAAGAKLLSLRHFNINNSHIEEGIKQINWPGRLERLTMGQTPVWLDGAHNPAAIKVLVNSLKLIRREQNGPLIMLLGIMADKDLPAMIKPLILAADRVIFTQPDYARACPAAKLAQIAGKVLPGQQGIITEPNMNKALLLGLELAGSQGQVLVTGSLFTVGQARSIINQNLF